MKKKTRQSDTCRWGHILKIQADIEGLSATTPDPMRHGGQNEDRDYVWVTQRPII